MTNLKPYPVMKDSVVRWLGNVPEHWEVRRLRNVAEMRVSNVDKHAKDEEQPVRLCNYVDVYKNDRISAGMAFMRASATKDEIERFGLQRGDVLITKDSEAWNDIGVPALVADGADDLISGYHLAVLRSFPDRMAGAFLFRALQSTSVAHQFHVEATGVTRYGLSHGAIKSVRVPLPPLPEQLAIVRFLDHAERRIRRYIRAKQKLIKLLKEQKQAVIHRSVIRGLDPDVRLKPSGVEWLGDIPEHWEVRKLRSLFRRHGSGTTPADDRYYGGGTPFVMTGDLTDSYIFGTKRSVTHAALKEVSALRTYPPGSLIVAMYGATIGKSGILKMEACSNQACCVLAEIVDSSDVGYLQAVVNLARAHLIEQSYGGSQPNVNAQIIRGLRVPVPPLEEQVSIAREIDSSTEEIAIQRARYEISLLSEYRIRLIADVVTGKLDVREVAARLLDDTGDSEPVYKCGSNDEYAVTEDRDAVLEEAVA